MTELLLTLVADDLRDAVAQCAAAAGYGLVDADPASCGRAWRTCRAVVVDPANVLAVEALSLPRRERVILVVRAAEPAGVWRAGVALGVEAAFELPGDEPSLVRHLTAARLAVAVGAGCAVALIGAQGGVGTTVLAAATSVVASAAHRVLLIDADELGGGVDLTLGVEDSAGLRWPDLTAATGQINAAALHDALPSVGRLSVLTGRRDEIRPIAPAAVAAVVDAGRAAGDVVVIDLPRADCDVTRAALTAVDVVVLVCGASVGSVAAGRSVRARLLSSSAAVEVAVRGPTLGGLRASEVADAIGPPLLTAYRPDPRLPLLLETTPLPRLIRKPLRRAATDVVDRARRAVAA